MANPKNRASVEEALRHRARARPDEDLRRRDSPLGLVEMTRQNVTDGPREILTRKCPTATGDGRRLRDTVAMQSSAGCALSLRPARACRRIASRCTPAGPRFSSPGPGGARLAAIEEHAKRRFFLVPAESAHPHRPFRGARRRGSSPTLQPAAPVVEGGLAGCEARRGRSATTPWRCSRQAGRLGRRRR